MRIDSIWAENFKSIGPRQSIVLSGATVLVGPNNAGKTNVLQILHALKLLAMGSVSWPDLQRNYLRAGTNVARVGLSFADSPEGRGTYEVTFSETGIEPFFGIGESGWGAPLRNFVNDHPAARELWSVLAAYDVWRLHPGHIDNAWPVQRLVRVGSQGEQAAALLDHLRDRYPEEYDRLQKDLRSCAPEIASVVAEASDSPGSKEIVFNERTGHVIRSRYASEGLKFLLFVLLILHSPDPPSLFAIEEIEHGFHPRRLRDVVSFLRQLVSSGKRPQVLVTTHSPYVLDQFRDTPEEVVIVERDEAGNTTCTRLVKRLENLKGKSPDAALGDLWYSGLLGGVPTP